ncbi:helix-turn-helix domain-containing protein [Paenibacillus methanolicus]|uniref:Cache domain-containing protein n=1 Tax=Paenibacillus methanolicus TaxID=582686 RepID=A0A5S5C4U1_9BACL|nr:helix-turn-helix domain-containing protein [Paenibacillus methanolicus]TYP73350.1 cache domain-containing protein [Paenibacillus methanolicus]
MKRFPMMLQLTLILFCVMAIPMAILTWYSSARIVQHSESAIAESSLAGLNANRRLNENALGNMAQDVVRLATSKVFDRIRGFETFAEANANYGNVSSTLVVLSELQNLNHRVDGVYSSMFYLSDSDYVVSTDKGITRLDRYEPLDWMAKALEGRRGISGVWVPRKLASGVNVVTYVMPLNRLSTTTRGTIVVNLQEGRISDYLRSTEPGKHGYFLLEADGTIISHSDKNLLLTDGRDQPFIREILDAGSKEGYAFRETDGERLIYTWSKSELLGWWNVNLYSTDELMTKARTLQRGLIGLTIVIIFAGAVLTVLLATWLSKPVRQLVRAMRDRGHLGVANKNELLFLDAAFKRMQEEEEGLYQLLKEREQDTRSLAIHNLLRGDLTKQIAELFPASCFRVAVVSIDRYRRYVSHANPETRNYHRYVLISQCDGLFPDTVGARCVYQGGGCFVIVLNYGEEDPEAVSAGIGDALAAIRDSAAELLGHTVTIGVSSQAEDSVRLSDLVVEAMEVIKHRMIAGGGGITYWGQQADRGKKYMYPTNSERRIVNFLDKGDLGSIEDELANVRVEIESAEYISYDNILFIYNQLVGVTIKHLRENNISTSRIFAGRGNVYSAIASIDTLDELEDYLRGFFRDITQYLARSSGEANYGERIIRYLETHFREEIVYEDMAKKIGISYSYMRKIAYEVMGKSLIDYVNALRIERAKQLLLETNLSMTQIAAEVGYSNVQSFNRFFRKFEGIPPSGFKALRGAAAMPPAGGLEEHL